MATDYGNVWIFNGPRRFPGFPSAVFESLLLGEKWVKQHTLSGIFTSYPVDISAYDWAVEQQLFRPKKPEHLHPTFIAGFSDASQEHFHYEYGKFADGEEIVLYSNQSPEIKTSMSLSNVWVFNGPIRSPFFPGAVFTDLTLGEHWVKKHGLTGTFTQYPVNIGVYDWAVEQGLFIPGQPEHTKPNFIENFSSAYQKRYYYDQGLLTAG